MLVFMKEHKYKYRLTSPEESSLWVYNVQLFCSWSSFFILVSIRNELSVKWNYPKRGCGGNFRPMTRNPFIAFESCISSWSPVLEGDDPPQWQCLGSITQSQSLISGSLSNTLYQASVAIFQALFLFIALKLGNGSLNKGRPPRPSSVRDTLINIQANVFQTLLWIIFPPSFPCFSHLAGSGLLPFVSGLSCLQFTAYDCNCLCLLYPLHCVSFS